MNMNANTFFRTALGAGTIMLAVGLSGCASTVGSHGYPRARAAAAIDYYYYPTTDVYLDIHGGSYQHRDLSHWRRVPTPPPGRKVKGSSRQAPGPENRDSARRRGPAQREVAPPTDRRPRSHPSTAKPGGRQHNTPSEQPKARRLESGDRRDTPHGSGQRGDNGGRRNR